MPGKKQGFNVPGWYTKRACAGTEMSQKSKTYSQNQARTI